MSQQDTLAAKKASSILGWMTRSTTPSSSSTDQSLDHIRSTAVLGPHHRKDNDQVKLVDVSVEEHQGGVHSLQGEVFSLEK